MSIGRTPRERALCSAERLVGFLSIDDSPEIFICREWALLWKHMTTAFGEDAISRGEDDFGRGEIDLGDPESN